jgi:hypothetical protein
MNTVIRIARSALGGVLRLFVDDGLYAAVMIAWITGVIAFGAHQVGSHVGGLVLALGLDLIFAVSVILRVRAATRTTESRKRA